MSTLRDKLKPVTGVRKQFILMRIAGLGSSLCRDMLNIPQGTFNYWLGNENFKQVFHQLAELEHDHRQEAIQMLRRENQLEAVLLEGRIVQKMKEELENGEYVLLKTNLAREVYSKLISDLDVVPQIKATMTWEQRLVETLESQPGNGEVYDAEFKEIGSQPSQHTESHLITEGEQALNEVTEGA